MTDFAEFQRLEKFISRFQNTVRYKNLVDVQVKDKKFPVYAIEIGAQNKELPTLVIVGGVHGLERVGTQLAISYLENLCTLLEWDTATQERLKHMRVLAVPLLNPGGMFLGRRSNPNGVDLMRNAPIDADHDPPMILGGHRYGPHLPYFRGAEGGAMEAESLALCNWMRDEAFPASILMGVDLHSGFGAIDRLWYPYAKTQADLPRLAEVEKLHGLLNRTYPNHVYTLESQSKSYTTHGDLWDYLFDEHFEKFRGQKPLIPWTLELGSWLWIRKNPTQLLSALGVFNPIKEHRFRRIMRRYLPLLDFFLRATVNYAAWWKA